MKASYDLLIVGAGFAAAVLAERFARNRDDRYLTEKFQALPADRYTALIHRMLDHPKIEVETRSHLSSGCQTGLVSTFDLHRSHRRILRLPVRTSSLPVTPL
jgi:UDP-galactopyranose mutase